MDYLIFKKMCMLRIGKRYVLFFSHIYNRLVICNWMNVAKVLPFRSIETININSNVELILIPMNYIRVEQLNRLLVEFLIKDTTAIEYISHNLISTNIIINFTFLDMIPLKYIEELGLIVSHFMKLSHGINISYNQLINMNIKSIFFRFYMLKIKYSEVFKLITSYSTFAMLNIIGYKLFEKYQLNINSTLYNPESINFALKQSIITNQKSIFSSLKMILFSTEYIHKLIDTYYFSELQLKPLKSEYQLNLLTDSYFNKLEIIPLKYEQIINLMIKSNFVLELMNLKYFKTSINHMLSVNYLLNLLDLINVIVAINYKLLLKDKFELIELLNITIYNLYKINYSSVIALLSSNSIVTNLLFKTKLNNLATIDGVSNYKYIDKLIFILHPVMETYNRNIIDLDIIYYYALRNQLHTTDYTYRISSHDTYLYEFRNSMRIGISDYIIGIDFGYKIADVYHMHVSNSYLMSLQNNHYKIIMDAYITLSNYIKFTIKEVNKVISRYYIDLLSALNVNFGEIINFKMTPKIALVYPATILDYKGTMLSEMYGKSLKELKYKF